MRTRPALGLLLLLGACNRGNVADVTLEADRAAENATAAKTLADIAAAEEAARIPLPSRTERAPTPAPIRTEPAADAPEQELPVSEDNSGDVSPQ